MGLVDAYCPHRAAHLYFGRNEECGLRCVYHGWKFDIDGNVVEMPNVPADARMRDQVRIKAYPTRELENCLGHLGPADQPIPEVRRVWTGTRVKPVCVERRNVCNWAQTMEGGLDTSHFSFLHMPASVPSTRTRTRLQTPADCWIRNDPMPQFSLLEHEVGFVVGERETRTATAPIGASRSILPSHGTGPSTLPGETYFGIRWCLSMTPAIGCTWLEPGARTNRRNVPNSIKGTVLLQRWMNTLKASAIVTTIT